MSASPRILVIGSANVDLVMNLPSLPTPGESIMGGTFRRAFGGKGANAAVAAAQAGADVALVGCVGQDSNGTEMLDNLKARKVDTRFIERHPTTPTGVAFIFIDRHAQNMIGVAVGANNEVPPARVDQIRDELRRADLVMIQNEITGETVVRVLQMAREDNLRVLYNCAPARAISPNLLGGVEWLILNETEAAVISGRPVTSLPEAEAVAQDLLQHGVKNVLITLGADGVCIVRAEGILHVPAFKVKAVDTVGAGDTFCGTFAVACGEGLSVPEAARFASAAAAVAVTREGAQNAAPSREEIEAFLKSAGA